MKANLLHKDVIGIYGIRNTINGKIYIGKSLNIHRRIKNHIGKLNIKEVKSENEHFINAWWKYGRNSFEYFVLETFEKDHPNLEEILKEKELFWMDYYKSYEREFGYNLRRDSATKMIVHEETKLKMSKITRKRYENNLEEREKISNFFKKFWKDNPEIKKSMQEKVSSRNTRYNIEQWSKDGKTFIKKWDKVKDIIKENPSYKVHNIYAVCSGEKPSMYGYKWFKTLIDDIVQTDLKDSE